MKRSLVLIPILLLVFLNACATGTGNAAPAEPTATLEWNKFWQALTATYMPPPTGTAAPNTQMIVGTMNEWGRDSGGYMTLEEKLVVLEDNLGADFIILDVQFQKENGVDRIFQVYAGCECASGSLCCTPEHMFVLTMGQLVVAVNQSTYQSSIASQVPGTIQEMEVVCLDRRKQIGVMSVPWADVQSFLRGELTGTQFAMRVRRE